ncbi:hypothetical protein TNCV_1033831 [Trichonephila clavipes]|nr:hypothetical protein TNCV_1033831 [Trichonephila clavipes]
MGNTRNAGLSLGDVIGLAFCLIRPICGFDPGPSRWISMDAENRQRPSLAIGFEPTTCRPRVHDRNHSANVDSRGHVSLEVKESDRGWHVPSSSPVSQQTRHVGERCTSNLSRAQTSSRWCGVVVRRGGASLGVVLVS